MRVLIVVTHLLGSGHLSRALTLGRAFADHGHDVLLATGGMPAPQMDATGVTMLQLPPLRSDGTNFTTLLDQNGNGATAVYLLSRSDMLCAAVTDHTPDIVITELYPFGRRVLKDEFLALLQTARAQAPRPVVLASVRDILAPPSSAAKADRTDQVIQQYYDAVLVHSDPNTTQLEHSWPVSPTLAPFLKYTGYVAPNAARPTPDTPGKGEIIVSAGGGSVGTALYETALLTARMMPEYRWRVLVGGSDAPAQIAALKQNAPDNAHLEPNRPDFRQMLAHAAASISMCGYNTTLDLLQSGTPAVLVPFDAGDETEQTLRANSLAHLPGISVLRSTDMTANSLRHAITTVMAAQPRTGLSLQFDGAVQTVALACDMAQARK